ncbi:hypothetical protein B0H19DRAFT_1250359 [Mycena capillaripes]|nr:hypothetical protein B0H19DRAFT_1250359 [Mycena capillaripes]
MSSKNALSDPLVGSSYFNPEGGKAYSPLRKTVVAQVTAMGYEVATMTEHGIIWADDQDAFGHVSGSTYARLTSKTNFCVFESFAKILGDKYDDMYNAKGVGVILKNYTVDLKRQAKYPDCLLLAVRITEVQPDRYFTIFTAWSYQQQAVVAESKGFFLFFDYRKREVANLIEHGGVYMDLYKDLSERCKKSNELYAQWIADHPKTNTAKL